MGKTKRHAMMNRLLILQRGKCCYCEVPVKMVPHVNGKKFPPHTATLKHLRRKCDGGSSDPDNLAVSCTSCNSQRGLIDWLTYKTYRMGELVA